MHRSVLDVQAAIRVQDRSGKAVLAHMNDGVRVHPRFGIKEAPAACEQIDAMFQG